MDAIVEGTVTRSGEQVRITAHLIHCRPTGTCGRRATSATCVTSSDFKEK